MVELDRRTMILALLAWLAAATPTLAQPFRFERTLPSPGGRYYFGFSVGSLGGNILVGATQTVGPGRASGAVHVFDGATGNLLQTIYNPNPPEPSYAEFGYAVTEVAGNILATDAFDDTDGQDAGIAHLFDGSTGALLHTFHNPSPHAGDSFGVSVAASGTRVFISAPWQFGVRGRIYLFDADPASPSFGALLQTFVPPPSAGGYFGNFHIATLGGNLVAGSENSSAPYGGIRAGAAYLLDAATGAVLQTYLNPSPEDNDFFGLAIATMGGNVIVGALNDNTRAPAAGAAYLFDGTTGALLQTFVDPTGAADDGLGTTVAVVNGFVVAGAPYGAHGGGGGAIHVFDPATGAHLQEIDSPGLDDVSFGSALAAAGPRLVEGGFGATAVEVYTACECYDGNSVDGDGCDSNCTITRCGNGIVTAGEECDDGNAADGDCCSSTCHFDAPYTPCADDGSSCTDDICDGLGFCNDIPHPVGSPCATDANACTHDVCSNDAECLHIPFTCAACLTCDNSVGCVPAPATGCQPALSGAARLVVKDRSPDGADALQWKWTSSADTAASIFGEPRNATAYDLCVYDGPSGTPGLFHSATIPAGGLCSGQLCWKATDSGFRYADSGRSVDGMSALRLDGGAAGKGRITLRARGPGLGLPPVLSLTAPLRVQLRRQDGLACWDATYGAPQANKSDLFRAKSD